MGLSLSMDSFAVSVGAGISIRDLKVFHIVRACFFFGFFQFIMPVAGWYLGSVFAVYIQSFDHWITFGLLVFVGGKMIWEAFRPSESTGGEPRPEGVSAAGLGDIRGLSCLLTLSLATNIDALAVGLSFSIIGQGIWLSAALMGGINFVVCLIGFEFGRRIGVLLEKWAGIIGGTILIGIGIKILIEHLAGTS